MQVLGKRDLRVELVNGFEEEQSVLGESHKNLAYLTQNNAPEIPLEISQHQHMYV